MLDIILQILSVLGIILLVLLCIIIVFLLLVLFFPVSYRISGKKDDEMFSVFAGADWLFGLFRARFAYPDPGRLTVKLLWITLYDKGASKQEEIVTEKEKKGEDEKNKGAKEKKDDIERSENREKTEGISENRTECHSDTNPQTDADATENTGSKDTLHITLERYEENQEEESQGFNRILKKIERIKFTICSTYDKIKKIWENISYYIILLQEEETHLLFSHAVKRLRKVFKNILPRKLKIKLLFGTGAPDTTGYVFGVYGMISPVLGPGVTVTPDFERTVLEGDLEATGYITSVVLVWQFLRVVLDRKLWRFIDKFKKGRETDDTFGTGMKDENTPQRKDGRKKKHRKKPGKSKTG